MNTTNRWKSSLKRSRGTGKIRRHRSLANLQKDRTSHRPAERLQFRWASAIPSSEWSIYARALDSMRAVGIQFMVGGGFAFAAYTGRWRNTKDIDLYVRPQDRERAIRALDRAGFKDYYGRLRYDRKWIYRSIRSNVIVDIIWAMANQRAQVDDIWVSRSLPLSIRGQELQLMPLEELIWCKLYIVQRDRCDWTDIFNLLYARGEELDWSHLLGRLDDDQPLLHSLLTLYGWLCPRSALRLPRSLWHSHPPEIVSAERAGRRSRLLDSRAWFAPMQAANRKLEI
jgi:putative nucleotidyltransferase-like protein